MTVIPSASNQLSRRHILTAAGACLVAAAVPSLGAAHGGYCHDDNTFDHPATIPPALAALAPDAARVLETGSPAARRMAAWLAVASDRELAVIAAETERQMAVLRAPIPNPQNTKGPVKGLAQSTGPSRSHRA